MKIIREGYIIPSLFNPLSLASINLLSYSPGSTSGRASTQVLAALQDMGAIEPAPWGSGYFERFLRLVSPTGVHQFRPMFRTDRCCSSVFSGHDVGSSNDEHLGFLMIRYFGYWLLMLVIVRRNMKVRDVLLSLFKCLGIRINTGESSDPIISNKFLGMKLETDLEGFPSREFVCCSCSSIDSDLVSCNQ